MQSGRNFFNERTNQASPLAGFKVRWQLDAVLLKSLKKNKLCTDLVAGMDAGDDLKSMDQVKEKYQHLMKLIDEHRAARKTLKESSADKNALKLARQQTLDEVLLLNLEKYKLSLLSALNKSLLKYGKQKKKVTANKVAESEEQNAFFRMSSSIGRGIKSIWSKAKKNNIIRHVLMFGFGFLALLATCADVFISMSESLPAILPMATNPVLLAATIGFTAIAAVLFFLFEFKIFQDVFGIDLLRNTFKERLETEKACLKQIKYLNQMVPDSRGEGRHHNSELQDLLGFKQDLVKDVAKQRQYRESYKMSKGKFAAKLGIGAVGILTHAAFGFFLGKSLIGLVAMIPAVSMSAATLLSNPIGWAIIATLMVGFIGLYIWTEFTSLNEQLHPAKEAYDDLLESEKSDFKSDKRMHIRDALTAGLAMKRSESSGKNLAARSRSNSLPNPDALASHRHSGLFSFSKKKEQSVRTLLPQNTAQ